MKKNIKIVRNELTPNIPGPPDFDLVYNKVKKLKTQIWIKKIILGSVVSIAACIAMFLISQPIKPQLVKSKNKIITSYVKPPSAKLDIKYDTIKVDLLNGDTILTKNGSKIIVPKNSIITNNGNIVEKSVLLYREFQNQTDIMLSGIPMMYDTVGKKLLLESAGMFEIKSMNINEKVNPNIPLTVKLSTQHSQQGFNAYKLNEKDGNWDFIEHVNATPKAFKKATQTSKSNMVSLKDDILNTITETYINKDKYELANKVLTEFNKTEPKLVDQNDFTFSIDPSYIEDLKLYQNISFLPLPSEEKKLINMPDELDYLTVKETPKNDVYIVTFYNKNKQTNVKCNPVFKNEKDYQKALITFKSEEKEFKDNQLKMLKEREIQMKNDEKEIQIQLAKNRKIAENKGIDYGQMVVSFSVNSFGYYNSDRPISNEYKTLLITYEIEGINEKISQLYQYYINKNAVMVNYNLGNNTTNIQYNNNDNCILVAIINNGKGIAILEEKEFKNNIIYKKESNVILKKVDKVFNHADEVQYYIKNLSNKK